MPGRSYGKPIELRRFETLCRENPGYRPNSVQARMLRHLFAYYDYAITCTALTDGQLVVKPTKCLHSECGEFPVLSVAEEIRDLRLSPENVDRVRAWIVEVGAGWQMDGQESKRVAAVAAARKARSRENRSATLMADGLTVLVNSTCLPPNDADDEADEADEATDELLRAAMSGEGGEEDILALLS